MVKTGTIWQWMLKTGTFECFTDICRDLEHPAWNRDNPWQPVTSGPLVQVGGYPSTGEAVDSTHIHTHTYTHTHWPTAKSTGLAPSQRRGRVRLLLSTPRCSGIRWYLRASISRSLHSVWWRTSSSVSTLLIRKSRFSSGRRTHFISWAARRAVQAGGDTGGGDGWSIWEREVRGRLRKEVKH